MSRDLSSDILRAASELFSTQGYAATSNKQIAVAARCTTAALYYYFPAGKAHILREVINGYAASWRHILIVDGEIASLADLLIHFGTAAAQAMPDLLRHLNWLMVAFPQLPVEQQAHLSQLLIATHHDISAAIQRFVPEAARADALAWLVFCAYFGYEQVFLNLGVHRQVALSYQDFAHTLAEIVARGT